MKETYIKKLRDLVSSLNIVQFIRTRSTKEESPAVCLGQIIGG